MIFNLFLVIMGNVKIINSGLCMSKKQILINIEDTELQYLEKITNELEFDTVEATIGKLIQEAGKDWFESISQEKFKDHIKSVPTEELPNIISTIPFMSRRFRHGFDTEIVELIVERLVDWDGAVDALSRAIYRLNNIRIMARDLKSFIEELDRKAETDMGFGLPLYNREQVIRLLVSSLYNS